MKNEKETAKRDNLEKIKNLWTWGKIRSLIRNFDKIRKTSKFEMHRNPILQFVYLRLKESLGEIDKR